MDFATFPLTRQNLTHSSFPNLLVYVVASHASLQGVRSVVYAAAHLTTRWLYAHAWGSFGNQRKFYSISEMLYFIQFGKVFTRESFLLYGNSLELPAKCFRLLSGRWPYLTLLTQPYVIPIYTRRTQCIVGSLYAVYKAAIFGVVQKCAR